MPGQHLTIGDFKRHGEPGSFRHYFETMLPNGDKICLEACMEGYCVGRYDAQNEIRGSKVCTHLGELMEPQVATGFSIGSAEALTKAVDIANTML